MGLPIVQRVEHEPLVERTVISADLLIFPSPSTRRFLQHVYDQVWHHRNGANWPDRRQSVCPFRKFFKNSRRLV